MKLQSAGIEQWRDISGFENYYQVSNFGRVRSLDRVVNHTPAIKRRIKGRALSPGRKTNGYYHVNLMINGRQYASHLHRLVLTAFVGDPPAGMECCHNDGDRSNNNLSNLRWDSHKANCLDRSLKNKKGHKLSANQVVKIKQLEGTAKQADIAKQFGVTQCIISAIYRGAIWSHIGAAA